MKKIDQDELKKIQIEILDNFAEFCEKNNIKYWLDCGTLLGCIRHGGYIPWDDDIDVGMFREDFDKVIELFNQQNDRYKFYCYENNKDFLYAFGKILDTSTILYEPDEKGNKLCVNIDVFVYDNAPDDPKECNKMLNKSNYYSKIHGIKISPYKKGNVVNSISRFAIKTYAKLFFKKDYFIRKKVQNCKKYINEKTKRCGNFSAFYKVTFDKKCCENLINKSFEGKEYKIPERYDEYLKEFYGDYMKLPPKEKQVTHHQFVAYKKD